MKVYHRDVFAISKYYNARSIKCFFDPEGSSMSKQIYKLH